MSIEPRAKLSVILSTGSVIDCLYDTDEALLEARDILFRGVLANGFAQLFNHDGGEQVMLRLEHVVAFVARGVDGEKLPMADLDDTPRSDAVVFPGPQVRQ